MKGLQASNFRRIHRGLQLDLIVLIASPVIFFVLAALLDKQMAAAGLAVDSLSTETVAQFSSVLVQLLFAFFVLRYCAAALCALVIISGLGEAEDCSPFFTKSKKCFIALMVMNAIAMVMRIASFLIGSSAQYGWTDDMYTVTELLLLVTRGVALYFLLRGYEEVLGNIGAASSARRSNMLANCTLIAFPSLGLARMADHFAPSMSDLANMILFIPLALIHICSFIICILIVIRSRKTTKMIADISEEVIA